MDSTSDEPAAIVFSTRDGGFSGEGQQGRRWHIFEERSGWRLSFRDPGDVVSTNAGVFGSLAAAQREANGARRNRRPLPRT